ncbi:microsomal epoxide hydrolase [Pseudomassariella vexata]|uniref:Microsomal epoxide hydrolase n=1 Tax=Pseudomassariella vexata TaxID=1141098 RepID=A0A1Y2EEQ8_9PEZI|nr:microsomal epoxide hydrolase [Pseudomassariella vexata]ORY69756.1 microsomal epoxide hydrolase [Pseudomassariella vexata]
MSDIKPYTISIESAKLADLQIRLSLVRFPDELDHADWDMGAPLTDIKRISRYWQDDFDWRIVEKELNKLPHFVTNIQCDGFDPLAIHFIHQPSPVKGAIPLLFIHGWPGHFNEVSKILKPLAEGDGVETPAFHIVAPSLPNFGFSEGVKKRGFAMEQYAATMNQLMLKLGYTEYVTQGGDWGCHISRSLAHLYPANCKATHLNFDSANPPEFAKNPLLAAKHAVTPYTKREKHGVGRSKWFEEEGSGYNVEQSTKPQTIGYGLADSPVACLAWIYEKLHDWTDSYPWTDEEICIWVSIYWFSTAGPAASMRIYYETAHNVDNRIDKMDRQKMMTYSPGVKLGFSHFPMDLHVRPSTWVQTLGEVVFEKDHESGGHFAAFERPDDIVADVREMFGRGGGAYGVAKGVTGYCA